MIRLLAQIVFGVFGLIFAVWTLWDFVVIAWLEPASLWIVPGMLALAGLFVALLAWPPSQRLARRRPWIFYGLGGALALLGVALLGGMIFSLVLPSMLQVSGAVAPLVGGILLGMVPSLLRQP